MELVKLFGQAGEVLIHPGGNAFEGKGWGAVLDLQPVAVLLEQLVPEYIHVHLMVGRRIDRYRINEYVINIHIQLHAIGFTGGVSQKSIPYISASKIMVKK